jgi:hypothetical protein
LEGSGYRILGLNAWKYCLVNTVIVLCSVCWVLLFTLPRAARFIR